MARRWTPFEKVFASDLNNSVVPTGAVMPFAGASAPADWLLCNGAAVLRTTYPDLFALIGTTYGVGDGTTTFNLPNLLGKIPVGYNAGETEFNALGKTGGEKAHILTIPEIPAHSHDTSGNSVGSGYANQMVGGNGGAFGTITTGPVGGGASHNNLQPYIALNYIIKP